MKIEIKKLHDNAKIPTRGSAFAAGYDLYAYFGDTVTMNQNEYLSIHHIKMDNLADKKSINIIDVVKYGCVKIEQVKLRTHYHYDIKGLFEKIQ